jgi:tetratricopeptide (TPR) repeat protein
MYALTMLTLLAANSASAPDENLRAGIAAASRQEWQAAHAAFQRSSQESSGQSLAAQVAAAESLFQQARYDEAGAQFGVLYEAIGGGDGAADALVGLRWAQCLAHQQQWRESREVATKELNKQLDSQQRARLHYVLGQCHSALGEHTFAREEYLEVVRTPQAAEPLKPRAHWMIAYSFAAEGDLATARETFLRLERRAQSTPSLAAGALIEAGRCSERLGDWNAAQADYKQAVDKYAAAGLADEASRRLAVVETRQNQSERR